MQVPMRGIEGKWVDVGEIESVQVKLRDGRRITLPVVEKGKCRMRHLVEDLKQGDPTRALLTQVRVIAVQFDMTGYAVVGEDNVILKIEQEH